MPVRGAVSDLVTPLADYPHVRDNATLRDVFAILKAKQDASERFRSVLVLDSSDHLVGKINLHGLLQAVLPDYLQPHPAHFEGAEPDLASLSLLWQEDSADQCHRAATKPVGPHARPMPATLAATDPLVKAIYLFARHDVNILPVVENGQVKGVLRIVDVLDAVARAMLDVDPSS